MDKLSRLLPHTRQQDHLQEHQARLTVSSARDHASASPGHVADRFIPCRSREEDQSAFDDFRSPKRFAYARNVSLCSSPDSVEFCAGCIRCFYGTGAGPTVCCFQQSLSLYFGAEDPTSRLADCQHLQVSFTNVSKA